VTPDSVEVQERAGYRDTRAGRPADAANADAQCVAARPRDPALHLALGSAQLLAA
jgi:hypothetical protein